MKTIVYELNEVPKKLFDYFATANPKSAFATLRNKAKLYQTYSADIGHLSPWITWTTPTLSNGTSLFKWTSLSYPSDLQTGLDTSITFKSG